MKPIVCIQGVAPIQNVITEVESWAGRDIEVEEVAGFPVDRGGAVWVGGTVPKLQVSAAGTSPSVVGHELLHLLLRVHGYPDRFEPSNFVLGRLDNFLQHKVIYDKYLTMGLPPTEFIRHDSQREVQETCAKFAAGKMDVSTVPGKLHVMLNSMLGFSEFNGLDETAKKALRGQLGWMPGNFWSGLDEVYSRARKGPKDYVKAMKQLVRLFGGDSQISPVFLQVAPSKAWPWA